MLSVDFGDAPSVYPTGAETLLSLAIAASEISENGGTATATVVRTLSAGELLINLTSSDETELTVPAQMTIPDGETSATFSITAMDDDLLDGAQRVTVTATAVGYVSGSDLVDVTDYETLSLTITPTALSENGGTATATVRRNNTDLSQPLSVSLASSDTTEATVPGQIVIPANQASAPFTIMAIDDSLLDGTQTVTVSVTAAGYVGDLSSVDITDYERLTVIAYGTVSENGGTTTATVTRSNTDRSQPLLVNLLSSDPSEATVPSQVTIAANQASATFLVTLVDDSLLDGTQAVVVSASAAGYVDGSGTINVKDYEALEVTITSSTISENGGTATGTVTRSNTDIGQELVVTLTSTDTTEAVVPAQVVIPANQASATFIVTAVDDDLMDGTQAVAIVASAPGYVDGARALKVADDGEWLSITVAPQQITENGGSASGTVTRSGVDLSQPLTVALVSSDATEAILPAEVIIPADQASTSFSIGATDDSLLDGTQTVSIAATVSSVAGGEPVSLDTWFPIEGGFPPTAAWYSDMTIQPDGKILTVGSSNDTLRVRRLRPDGLSDPTFGTYGLVTTQLSASPGRILVQANGQILVSATLRTGGNGSVLLRYNADGSPDLSFGTGGIAELDFFLGEIADMAVRTDGKIMLAVDTSPSQTTRVVRLNPDGSADVTFGSSGVKTYLANDVSHSIVQLDDGRFLLAGYRKVARFHADGTLDTTFGSGGSRSVGFGAWDSFVLDVAVDHQGRIILGGYVRTDGDPDTSNMAAARLSADGTPDRSFNGTGTVVTDFDSLWGEPSMVVQADGKVVLAGHDKVSYGDTDFLMIRYDVAGELDPTFDDDGCFRQEVVSSFDGPVLMSIALDADGRLVALKSDGLGPYIARYHMGIVEATAQTSATLAVTDYEPLLVNIVTGSISERAGTTTATVTRTDPSGDLTVNLVSSDTTEVAVAISVVIADGQTTSAPIAIDAADDDLLDGTQTVVFTASAAGYVDGSASVDVADYEVLTVAISPPAISESGGTATGTVTRSNTDNSQALVVTLLSNDGTEAVVPSQVTIPASQNSTTFTVTAVDDSLVDGTQRVWISASATGYESIESSLDVVSDEDPGPLGRGHILVASELSDGGSRVMEYTATGMLVRQLTPVYGAGDVYPDGNRVRDLVVNSDGNVLLYNGTAAPYLTELDPVTWTFSHLGFVGWSTADAFSYGGIAVAGQFVFVTDMNTAGAEANGIVRFDTTNGTAIRFAAGSDYRDLALGLDGRLYGLRNPYQVDIFDTGTLAAAGTMYLPSDVTHTAIAADASGHLFAVESTGDTIRHYDASGLLLDWLDSEVVDPGDIDLALDGRIVVGSRLGKVVLADTRLDAKTTFAANADSTAIFVALCDRNQAPVAIPGIYNTDEDTSRAITLVATDPDGDPLTFTVIQPSHGTLTGTAPHLTYQPDSNYVGNDSFTFTANDGLTDSNAVTVSIAVRAVNDPPTLAAVNTLTGAREDMAFAISFAALAAAADESDVEGDSIAFRIESVSSGTLTKGGVAVVPGATLLASNGTIVWTPPRDVHGVLEAFTVRAWDGQVVSAAAVPVRVEVLPVNDVPSFAKGVSQTINEDAGPQTVTGWATGMSAGPANETGQTWQFLVGTNNAAMFVVQPAISPGGTLSYTPAPNANGQATVSVRMKDDGGLENGGIDVSAPQTFTITVNPVSDAPTLESVSTLTGATEDSAFAIGYDLLAAAADEADADGDGVAFRIESVTSGSLSADGTAVVPGVTLLAPGSELVWTLPADDNGVLETFAVRAWDGQALSSTAVPVRVEVRAVNDRPSFTEGIDPTVAEDAGPQTVSGWATGMSAGPADETGQQLAFVLENDFAGLFSVQPAVSADGTLTYTPAADAHGQAVVTIRLHDDGGTAHGGIDRSEPVTFTITVTAVNDAPVLASPIPDQSATEDETFRFTFAAETFYSADTGDRLSYTASQADGSPLPEWLSFDASTRTFSGTPEDADIGTVTVRVMATDSSFETVSGEFLIEVVNGNDPPAAVAGGPYWIDLGGGLVLDGSASSDPDEPWGDAIESFQWDLRGDGTFEYAGAIVSVPWADLAGLPQPGVAIPVRLRVADRFGATSTAETEMRIFDNQPLAAFTAAPNPAPPGYSITFDANGSSHGRPDRNIVAYEWDFDEDGEYDDAGGSVVAHAFANFGSYTVGLRVTDDNSPPKTTAATVVVDIQLGNVPPVAEAGGPYYADLGVGIALSASGSYDPNESAGDAIVSYAWDIGNGMVAITGAGPSLAAAQIDALGLGTHSVVLTVTDEFGATDTDTTTLAIYDNRPLAVVAADPNPAAYNQTVNFDAGGSWHGRPDRSIVLYEWDFDYDGASFDVGAVGIRATHIYSHFGQYVAALRVTDDNVPAKTSLATVLVDVSLGNQAPVADAGGPYWIDMESPLALDGTSSLDPDAGHGDAILGYQWDFQGDGSYEYSGPQVNVPWADLAGLPQPGASIAVRLTVTDTFGATHTDTTELRIFDNRPFAGVTSTPNPAAPTEMITFDASGSWHGRPDRSIVRYEWDFGDGSSYTETAADAPDGAFDGMAAHGYAAFGSYTVLLTVGDDNTPAKNDTASLAINVNQGNRAPVAEPGGAYQVAYGRGLLLDGSGSSDPDAIYGDAIVGYRWDLGGDGDWDYSGVHAEVVWKDLAGLPLGRPIPVRLEVTDSFGLVGSRVAELTVLPPESLGTVDFHSLRLADLSGGDVWYQIVASYDGQLTVEAASPDVVVALFDASFGHLRTSVPQGGFQRLDQPALAGQSFYLQFRGEAAGVDVRIANLLEHQGTIVTIHGTAEGDAFVFDASSPTRQVTIRGVLYEFAEAEASTFFFDGLAGNDDVRVVGGEEVDTAVLRPSAAFVRGSGYTVAAANVESSTFDGGGGEDVARLYGSRRTNTFALGADESAAGIHCATLGGSGVAITGTAENVYADGNGGKDTAELRKLVDTDRFEPHWRQARMVGEDHACRVDRFHSTVVYEMEGEAATSAAAFLDVGYDRIGAGTTAEDKMTLTEAAVDQTTQRSSGGVSLDDLARLLWLGESEKLKPRKTTTAEIDRVFAYWE